MNIQIPDAEIITTDVEKRLGLLGKLLDLNEDLTDDEWDSLIYYGALHRSQRSAFKDTLNDIRFGKEPQSVIKNLSPHARWLAAVYTGQELTTDWCAGGSRFHKRVLQIVGYEFTPVEILEQINGLLKAVRELQERFPQANPKLIENIAVDETFELLGRAMGSEGV